MKTEEETSSSSIDHTIIEPFDLPEYWCTDRAQVALADQIRKTWRLMELRFRRAVQFGHCRLLARCGAAHVVNKPEA